MLVLLAGGQHIWTSPHGPLHRAAWMSSQHWSWFPHSEWSLSKQGRSSSVFYNLSIALLQQHFHNALLVTWATQTSSRMKETIQDPDPVDENHWGFSWRLATTGKFWRISVFLKSRSMYINWKYGVNYQEEILKVVNVGSNLNVHQQMNGKRSGSYIQWNIA